MSSIVPTISSGTAGPLGVKHLPRLWQKASLDAVGKLHPDYPAAGQGYDQMTLDALGIDRQAFLDFVAAENPTYVACEAWVKENGTLDAAKIETHNAGVDGYRHEDAVRGEILDAAGLPDNGNISGRREPQQSRRLASLPPDRARLTRIASNTFERHPRFLGAFLMRVFGVQPRTAKEF